jgi:hypothetical protein
MTEWRAALDFWGVKGKFVDKSKLRRQEAFDRVLKETAFL